MVREEVEFCEATAIHEDTIQKAKAEMLEENLIRKIGDFFKVLGDPTRIKIINLLFKNELCVCDLVEIMEMQQPAISQQLKILKQANLVKYRKEGKNVFYALSDEHVKQIFDQGMVHVMEKL
jgi:ArsR family transcriptional regulator